MKITYDPKVNAMYIKFQDGNFAYNKEVEEGVIFDMGDNDTILGIEILEASQRLKHDKLSPIDIQIPLPTTVA